MLAMQNAKMLFLSFSHTTQLLEEWSVNVRQLNQMLQHNNLRPSTLFAVMCFQIINTEWGAFSNGLPLTEFDREMDADSINPGEQVS